MSSGDQLEPFGVDVDAELAWLVRPETPPPSPAELVRQRLQAGLPLIVDGLIRLAVSAESEKARLDASRYLLQLAGLVGVADLQGTGLDALLRQFGAEGTEGADAA
jgi:hypothetical protein